MTANGKINSKLLGLITFRDIDFLSKDQWSTMPVSQVMTPIDELITANSDLTLKDAYHILQRSKKGQWDDANVYFCQRSLSLSQANCPSSTPMVISFP